MKNKKKGFTLLEILVTILITAIIFSLLYATFNTIALNSSRIMENYGEMERLIGFLKNFSTEIKSIFFEKEECSFSSKSISFITKRRGFSYPVKVNYEVKSNLGKDELWRKEENPLYNYTFCFPIIRDCDEIYFSFLEDGEWKNSFSDKKLPEGIGIFIKKEDLELFYPVICQEK